jgi:hypothetical protein
MRGFAAQLRAASTKALQRVNVRIYMIARELFTEIVTHTPSKAFPGQFASGWLANQWYPDTGDFSEELDNSHDSSGYGADSLARIRAFKGGEFNGKDGRITLTNNMSYAYRAEALGWPKSDGWSGAIGPYRMVALSLQKVAAKYQ